MVTILWRSPASALAAAAGAAGAGSAGATTGATLAGMGAAAAADGAGSGSISTASAVDVIGLSSAGARGSAVLMLSGPNGGTPHSRGSSTAGAAAATGTTVLSAGDSRS